MREMHYFYTETNYKNILNNLIKNNYYYDIYLLSYEAKQQSIKNISIVPDFIIKYR